jgi:hypothetical protein
MSVPDKEAVAPEVRSVAWLSLRDAFKLMLSSMSAETMFVNEWQRHVFAKHGIARRYVRSALNALPILHAFQTFAFAQIA